MGARGGVSTWGSLRSWGWRDGTMRTPRVSLCDYKLRHVCTMKDPHGEVMGHTGAVCLGLGQKVVGAGVSEVLFSQDLKAEWALSREKGAGGGSGWRCSRERAFWRSREGGQRAVRDGVTGAEELGRARYRGPWSRDSASARARGAGVRHLSVWC